MKKVSSIILIMSLSISAFAKVDVKSLDIYKNRTFINQNLDTSKNSVDLLSNVQLNNIRFISEGKCEINDVLLVPNNTAKDKISKEIKNQKEKIAFKNNEIKAVSTSIKYLENIKFQNDAVNLKNIKGVFSYAQKEILANNNALYKLRLELNELNKRLNELTNKKRLNLYSKLTYKADCSKSSSVYISYPISNISKNGFYEINANTKNKTIKIEDSSFILQNTGHDFKNIDINMYTYSYYNAINPAPFRAKYLDVYKARPTYAQADSMQMERSVKAKSAKRVMNAPRPSNSYNETATKAFFKASNINLISGNKTAVVFSNNKYKMNDKIEIDGYSSSQAFYKVDFKSDKLYSSQNAKLYLDGVFIGQKYLGQIKKDKKISLYFGVDSFIEIKKELIKDMKEEPFFSMSTIKTEKIWNYKITNKHKSKKTIVLVEKLPISKHEDIKVSLISKPTFSKKENKGKISYDLVLESKTNKEIQFGYIIEKPYNN